MKIIDKYVYAVTALLPEKNREDIKKELTSLLWDAVEERAGENEPDEKTAIAVLKELGPPAEMAKKYTGETVAVIGPHLTDTFWLVVRTVLPIMFIIVAVGSAIDLAVERPFSDKIIQWIVQTASSFVGAGINAFGVIALVFAGITWVQRNKGETGSKPDWSPADLPEISDSAEKVKLSEPVMDIIFTLIGLEIFNFMPDILFFMIGGFNKAVLYTHLPLFNIALIANVLFSFLILFKRRWTTTLRVLNICLGAFALFAVAALFLDPNIFTPFGEQEKIAYNVAIGLRITVAVIGITWIVDSVKHLKKIIVKR